MNNFKVIIFIFFCCASSAYAQGEDQRLTDARKLYSCFSFFLKNSKTGPIDQREKLARISTKFLLAATQKIVAADDDKDPAHNELAKKYHKLGQNDFKHFMDGVILLPSEDERNESIGKFVKSCSSSLLHTP